MYKKKIQIQQENLYKINFPTTTTKKTQPHNCIVTVTTKTISHQNQKKQAQHHNCMEL